MAKLAVAVFSGWCGLSIAVLTAAGLAGLPGPAAAESRAAARPLAVHVRNNLLVDQDGNPFRLLGVNRSGTEYTCLTGSGIFDGPVDAAAIAAIAAWHTNAVWVPLNEDCWLGINLGSKNPAVGKPYRRAIAGFVGRLNRAGLSAILELHWNAPGNEVADGQQPMADLDHAPAFWASVAAAFKSNPAVVFDLYNEPYINSWRCWRDGCTVTTASGSWKTAGMRALVNAVRAAGATQPIIDLVGRVYDAAVDDPAVAGAGTAKLPPPLGRQAPRSLPAICGSTANYDTRALQSYASYGGCR